MDKIGCGKWNIWIVVLLLGTTLSAVVTTQPVGFLSIDCGGKANHTDENNITWVTDANYIDIGQTGKTGDAIQLGSGSYSQNLRYPQDNFDRLWLSDDGTRHHVRPISTEEPILTNNTEDLPPMMVMQTAWVLEDLYSAYPQGSKSWARTEQLVTLYFAEIEILNMSESRSFYITTNNERRSENINLIRNYSAVERRFLLNNVYILKIVKAKNSTRLPIVNAAELFYFVDTEPATHSQDIEALDVIKTRFNMKKWISDPCYLIPWEGIGCDNRSSEVRISEINLSGRNLTIPVPEEIGQLTALVNLSLENNHLMGALPNFSSLTMLERLYLQNNSLNGSVPDWLSGLKNLKELFSGVIPAQLLLNRSLKLILSGNPYLCVHKGDCILPNSNKNKKRVVLGITLGGILIIAVALIVGIVVYRKKFRRKGGMAAKSSGMKTNEEISYF